MGPPESRVKRRKMWERKRFLLWGDIRGHVLRETTSRVLVGNGPRRVWLVPGVCG